MNAKDSVLGILNSKTAIRMSRKELRLATRMTCIEDDNSRSYVEMASWMMDNLVLFLRSKGIEVTE